MGREANGGDAMEEARRGEVLHKDLRTSAGQYGVYGNVGMSGGNVDVHAGNVRVVRRKGRRTNRKHSYVHRKRILIPTGNSDVS